ncbi:hypothetical protein BD408DRAFT_56191 [Parasitella parasitica]|nr:hypothetical protein BD408DRAFT_56191 [Parasitella parasitica]
MSSGDTPSVRFTSPSPISTPSKKYTTTPKSPIMLNNNSSSIGSGSNSNTNTGNRNSQARQRLLSSKVSAPRPINLPSLRREHAVGSDALASSPATSHGWGSASSSPSMVQQQVAQTDIEPSAQPPEKKPVAEAIIDKTKKSPDTATSPVLIPAAAAAVTNASTTARAWAVPTITQTPAPSTDFPTAAEAASGTNKKPSLIDEYLMYASSDPNHISWDEMVSEDLDEFSVDVVEFEDGTKIRVESDSSSTGSRPSSAAAAASKAADPVLPSERFTDDYDRSYPAKQQYHHHHDNSDHQHHNQSHHNQHPHPHYKSYRRSEDHGYSSRYNNASYNSRRASTEGTYERRNLSASGTNDRWTSKTAQPLSTRRDNTEQPHYGNRRSSYDRKHDNGSYHHAGFLPRSRRLSDQSFRSDHSREENSGNPLQITPDPITVATTDSGEEITAVQKSLMLTAAERAKKRLEEQEAEFKAVAERAKQKADALAAKQSELKTMTILKKPAADKSTVETSAETPATAKRNTSSSSSSSPPPPPSSSSPSSPLKTAPVHAAPATASKAVPLSFKIPDTSKPWNLVAANKQAPKPATTTATAAAVNSEPKTSPSREHLPAPTQILKKETKPVAIVKKEPKPTRAGDKKEKGEGKPSKSVTDDDEKWEKYVSAIRTDPAAAAEQKNTSADWVSFAVRLQETVAEKNAIDMSNREKRVKEVEEEMKRECQQKSELSEQAQQKQHVEVLNYEDEEWGSMPATIMNGRTPNRGGWTRDENFSNQKRSGRNTQNGGSSRGGRRDTATSAKSSRDRVAASSHHKDNEENPVVIEILKKHEPGKKAILSKKTRLTNLLKNSSSPIFPDFIDKLAARKPANMSFMVDTEESDEEITLMGQTNTAIQVEEEEAISVATTATTVTSNSNSTASALSKSHPPQQRKMHVNRHFPVLVYRYPGQPTCPGSVNSSKSVEPEAVLFLSSRIRSSISTSSPTAAPSYRCVPQASASLFIQ